MLTKAECQELVKRPGPLEGEPPETAYFYQCAMWGDGDPAHVTPDGDVITRDFEAQDVDPRWIYKAAAEAGSKRFILAVGADGCIYGRWADAS